MSNYSRNPLLQLTSLLYTLCALGGNCEGMGAQRNTAKIIHRR